jgi:hypothetical protein
MLLKDHLFLAIWAKLYVALILISLGRALCGSPPQGSKICAKMLCELGQIHQETVVVMDKLFCVKWNWYCTM